ncbi:S9 family peptidase [Roseobacter sinensis]|uniref:Prolyl oligopeptidase family serine peptidase n=1 Tax=Roseobacter sinensis TaxID=2931391 RepID=A0ABT3BII2_9RHOB|nr:prolyl oligopeptidase family serine peptidase [Roseobacter sp. WL0113]MCV3273372.1 prolyl oligopeptidase family serine peptidase [Roseobacter sp. WL0113]
MEYRDRTVDLAPYFFGFPYNIREVSLEAQKVYYTKDERDGGSHLYVQPWNDTGQFDFDPEAAERVTDVDIESINFWGRRYNRNLDALVVMADEGKREDINLWLFSEREQDPIKLTDVDYVYDFAQSPDHRTIAFVSRDGDSDDQEGCLQLLSISDSGATSTERLFCDSDEKMPATLNWWAPLRIDDKNIVFTALADGDRNRKVLYRYDRTSKEVIEIAAASDGSWLGVMNSWEDGAQILYAQDTSLFFHDIPTGTNTELNDFENTFRVVTSEVAGRRYLQALTKGVSKTTYEVFAVEGNSLSRTDHFVTDVDIGFEHAEDHIAILYKTSAETIADFELVEIDASGRMERGPFVAGLDDLNERLTQCSVSLVTYDSIDGPGETKAPAEVQAYLYEPLDPIAPEDRLYVIEAFYGGGNSFSRTYHSLCGVGITVLSPVVRGDSRFGSEFETANDGKNADAPILDVIAGARFLEAEFELADTRRIGTIGFSHGGWAAVRALSYPGPEHFDFGFAMAGAGIYDVLQMADGAPEGQTNIRGWFDKEFGDLETERAHLAYLSATSHLDKIDAPIFLFHGRNDERITALHSISFAEVLENAGKDHELLIIDDQGHSIRGAHNWHRINSAALRFLEEVDAGLD